MTQNKNLSVAILAAGKGKRMLNPSMAKVMAMLDGTPLIGHVVELAQKLQPEIIVVIIGHQRQSIVDYIESKNWKNIKFAVQEEQLGTGHAVEQTKQHLSDSDSVVLILSGDVPLLSSKTLENFIIQHNSEKADLSVLSTLAPNPTGYGRIIRDSQNNFIKIVEEKDANDNEKKIQEINSGIYLVSTSKLFDALQNVKNENSQGEYYLTDVIEIMKTSGACVKAFAGAKFDELQGVNSPDDLKKVEDYYFDANK